MKLDGKIAVVTGGASGLGLSCSRELIARGAKVVIVDLPTSSGAEVAADLGNDTRFVPADVSDEESMNDALATAEGMGEVRALVHCAGRGGPLRIVDKDGNPGSLEAFEAIVRTNLIGSFNALRLAAARMARLDPIEGERGICVLTASIAAYEGQISQVPYASSKAGIVGLTFVAARDLSKLGIRVCAIAPGVFDTPLLRRLNDEQRAALANSVPHPSRLGEPKEFAGLACHIIENRYLNGETIRLDGGLRMAPR